MASGVFTWHMAASATLGRRQMMSMPRVPEPARISNTIISRGIRPTVWSSIEINCAEMNASRLARQGVSRTSDHSSLVGPQPHRAGLIGSGKDSEGGVLFLKHDSPERHAFGPARRRGQTIESTVGQRNGEGEFVCAVIDDFVVCAKSYRVRE